MPATAQVSWLALSFSISDGAVIGGSSSYSLSDCTFAEIGFTPMLGGGVFALVCDDGVNEIDSTGNSFWSGGLQLKILRSSTYNPPLNAPVAAARAVLVVVARTSLVIGHGAAIAPECNNGLLIINQRHQLPV